MHVPQDIAVPVEKTGSFGGNRGDNLCITGSSWNSPIVEVSAGVEDTVMVVLNDFRARTFPLQARQGESHEEAPDV